MTTDEKLDLILEMVKLLAEHQVKQQAPLQGVLETLTRMERRQSVKGAVVPTVSVFGGGETPPATGPGGPVLPVPPPPNPHSHTPHISPLIGTS